MTETRREYAHPFYWAPFVLVGKYEQDSGATSRGDIVGEA